MSEKCKEGQLVCCSNCSPFEYNFDIGVFIRKSGNKYICKMYNSENAYTYRYIRPLDELFDVALTYKNQPGTTLFEVCQERDILRAKKDTISRLHHLALERVQELENEVRSLKAQLEGKK